MYVPPVAVPVIATIAQHPRPQRIVDQAIDPFQMFNLESRQCDRRVPLEGNFSIPIVESQSRLGTAGGARRRAAGGKYSLLWLDPDTCVNPSVATTRNMTSESRDCVDTTSGSPARRSAGLALLAWLGSRTGASMPMPARSMPCRSVSIFLAKRNALLKAEADQPC